MGKYKDYVELSFNEEWQRYNIGDANDLELIADEILFFASEDCLVKFLDSKSENSEPAKVFIPQNIYIVFGGKIRAISVKRKGDTDGTLKVWSEGDNLIVF